MRISVFGGVMVAAGVLVISCGCSSGQKLAADNSSTPAGTASTPSSTSSPAGTGTPASAAGATTPASSTASGSGSDSGAAAACATSSLRVTKSNGNGAAGSFYFQLNFTNTGPTACTLFGYPGVSFTTSGHAQLGSPATREPAHSKLVTLKPGATNSATLRVTDVSVFSKDSCHPASAALIKIYPPNQTAPLYITGGTEVCTTSQGRAGIWPVGVGMG